MLDRVRSLVQAGKLRELPPEERRVIMVRVPPYATKIETNKGGRKNILDIQELANQKGVDIRTLLHRLPPGAVIMAWRETRNLRVTDLARKAGIPVSHLSIMETRQTRPRDPELLVSIADALEITVEDIKTGRLPDGVTVRFVPARTLTKSQA